MIYVITKDGLIHWSVWKFKFEDLLIPINEVVSILKDSEKFCNPCLRVLYIDNEAEIESGLENAIIEGHINEKSLILTESILNFTMITSPNNIILDKRLNYLYNYLNVNSFIDIMKLEQKALSLNLKSRKYIHKLLDLLSS